MKNSICEETPTAKGFFFPICKIDTSWNIQENRRFAPRGSNRFLFKVIPIQVESQKKKKKTGNIFQLSWIV